MAKTVFGERLRWLKALPLAGMVAIMAALALLTLANADARNGGLRERLFDLYGRIFPADISVNSDFHVVEIDRESIAKIGPWPWPRSMIASMVEASVAAKAKGVVYLEGVDSPDPLSPETIGDFWLAGARDPRLAQQLALLPSTDLMLARSLAETRGAIAVSETAAPSDASKLQFERADASGSQTIAASGATRHYGLPSAPPRFPVNADLLAAAPLSVAALPADDDGVVRAAPLLWSVRGRVAALAAAEGARIAAGAEKISISPDSTAVTSFGASPKSLKIGARAIETSSAGAIRLWFPRRIATPKTSAWKLLREGQSRGELAGKVVIIGLDDAVGASVKTARGDLSAPEAHALIGRQLAAGVAPTRPYWFGYGEALAVLFLGAAAIMWSQRLDFWKAIGVAALLSAILFGGSMSAFAVSGALIDPLAPALALFLGAFTVAGGRSIGAALKDDNVRGSFHGSLPEPTMKKVREEGTQEVLEGALRPLTVLACELSLSEDDTKRLAESPNEVTNLIGAGCVHLKKAIIEAGGAADQAEGGRILAYFNAPLENADHIRDACAGSLKLIESMDKINAEIESAPHLKGVALHLAIGVASGECFVGPMGHGRSNRYSAIGQTVELAAFLCRQATVYGPAIICDDLVRKRTDHHFAFLELDSLKEPNSDRPFSIYALVGNPFIKSSKGFRALEDAHRQLLTAYRAGDYLEAKAALARVRQSPGSKIALFDLYERRIQKLADAASGAEKWDGSTPVTL